VKGDIDMDNEEITKEEEYQDQNPDTTQITYPDPRGLDTMFFRVNREDKWENHCLTDLTWEERDMILSHYPVEKLNEFKEKLIGCLTAMLTLEGYSLDENRDIIELLVSVIRTISNLYGISAKNFEEPTENNKEVSQ